MFSIIFCSLPPWQVVTELQRIISLKLYIICTPVCNKIPVSQAEISDLRLFWSSKDAVGWVRNGYAWAGGEESTHLFYCKPGYATIKGERFS